MSKIFHTGNIIITGFVICALGMLFLAYKTTQVHFDLSTTEDPYSKEVEFNQKLLAQKNIQALGNTFSMKPDSVAVTIQIPSDISRKITEGTVEFYCYSNSKLDKTTAITSSQDGTYTFKRSEFMTGNNYNIKISFTAGGVEYYNEMKVF